MAASSRGTRRAVAANLTGTADLIPVTSAVLCHGVRRAYQHRGCNGCSGQGGLADIVGPSSSAGHKRTARAYDAAYPDCDCLNGDIDNDNNVDLRRYRPVRHTRWAKNGYRRVFTWDAENRLTSVGPYAGNEETNDVKVEFAYDYRGRRVSKVVSTYTGSAWQVSEQIKYVWDGWLMLLELELEDAQPDDDDYPQVHLGPRLGRPEPARRARSKEPAASLTRLRRVKHRSAVCWRSRSRKRSATR